MDLSESIAFLKGYLDVMGTSASRNAFEIVEKEIERIRSVEELLKQWLKFSEDVKGSCCAGDSWLDELKEKTKVALGVTRKEDK